MNTVFFVLFSYFVAVFCLPNTQYLHHQEEAVSPIQPLAASLKRDYDSVGPAANFLENPITALIVAGGINNSIYHVCTGSILNTPTSNLTKEFNLKTSFILTTSYCLLDRKDRDSSDGTKNLVFKVLIQNPQGALQLAGNNWTVFNLTSRLFNPNMNTIKNYSVNVTIPPGASQIQNVSVNTNDIGLVELTSFIDIPGVQATSLKRPADFKPGDPVASLGYGSPNFFELHKTSRTKIIFTLDGQTQQPATDMIFFHDSITELASTTPSTPVQAIESGDEGGPILNANNEQIGIAQATWRVQVDSNSSVTFASIGLSTDFYYPYITGVLRTRNTSTTTQPPPVDIQSAATFSLPSLILCMVALILSSIV